MPRKKTIKATLPIVAAPKCRGVARRAIPPPILPAVMTRRSKSVEYRHALRFLLPEPLHPGPECDRIAGRGNREAGPGGAGPDHCRQAGDCAALRNLAGEPYRRGSGAFDFP